MSTTNLFTHPETETRLLLPGSDASEQKNLPDLLEVYPEQVVWKEGLDHAQPLNFFRVCQLFIYDERLLNSISKEKRTRKARGDHALRVLWVIPFLTGSLI